VLSVIQSLTIANTGGQSLAAVAVYTPGPSFILMTILTLTTGSAFIIGWRTISERGIGNGMSLIISPVSSWVCPRVAIV